MESIIFTNTQMIMPLIGSLHYKISRDHEKMIHASLNLGEPDVMAERYNLLLWLVKKGASYFNNNIRYVRQTITENRQRHYFVNKLNHA